jgi:16S rRNA G966 N2-methylase RsmD
LRIAAQTKLGFYPTPLAVVELLRKIIAFPNEETHVLDPCCGAGEALEALTRGTKALTHGIELDADRAAEAKKRLRHVIHAGYEDVEVSPGSMGLLFLNPPYDDQEGERKEFVFLRDLIDTLAPSGILVYIFPQARLTREVATLLASNFTQVRVQRFPDPEFDAFGQIVVVGKKSDWPFENPREAENLAAMRERDLPPLDAGWPRYSVPAVPNAVFRVRPVRPEDLVALARTSPLLGRIRDLTEPSTLGNVARPPTRLHVGHLGLLLAAGRLNGLVGTGDARHIVVGKPVKAIVETTEKEEDAEGNPIKVEKRLETFKVTIKMLLPNGEIRRLN